MSGTFDIYTLLLLVVAVVILLRLRNLLGRKTGHERRYDSYTTRESGGATAPQDKVVPLPGRPDPAPRMPDAGNQKAAAERIGDFMPDTNPAHAGLVEIARQDPSFDPKHFVQGAKSAYEMIVTAFAEGNKRILKQFLSREVYDGFAESISGRESRGETVDTSFVGINKADVIDAEVKNRTARVTVKFVSQLITAIKNRNGELIEGDPRQIREVTDIWTFARELSSRDPNWKLIATQAAN
ncbi:MAG: Tim44/TimA family putative adaptor protein [Hyphomicrobiaceae bacterium]